MELALSMGLVQPDFGGQLLQTVPKPVGAMVSCLYGAFKILMAEAADM